MRRSSEYLKNINNIKNELEKIIENEYVDDNEKVIKLAHAIPTSRQLRSIDSSLESAIRRYHYTTLKILLKDLGYETKGKKPTDYWKDNLEREIIEVIAILGHFPTPKELIRLKRKDLFAAIEVYGGFRTWRERLAFNQIKAEDNFWKDFSNVEKILRPYVNTFLKEHGRLPTGPDLRKSGLKSLEASLYEYHGGLYDVYTKMGYNPDRKPSGYWEDENNFKNKFVSFVEEFRKKHGKLPTQKNFNGGLSHAIQDRGGLKLLFEKYSYSKIRSFEDFIYFLENEKIARLVLEKFGSDEAVVADVMAIIYENRITSREELLRLLEAPSLKEYLGKFKKPEGGIGDLVEAGTHILPFDKGGKIRDILYNDELEKRDNRLGPRPSKEERGTYLTELSKWIKKIESSKEKDQPHIIILKDIIVELFNDTTELYEMYEKGIEGLARRVRNPEFEGG